MDELEFYKTINDYLVNIAELLNINDLEKYYKQTDLLIPGIRELENGSINQIFAEYIMLSQDASIISNVVNFNKNHEFLKKITCEFSPKDFLSKYGFNKESDRDESVKKIKKALKYRKSTNKEGLNFINTKKNTIIERFANSLIDGALYLKDFNSRDEVIQDLKEHYQNNDFKILIEYVLSKFKHGFSIALSANFLKEISSDFDLPKPDVHIMEVLAKFKNYNLDYYKKNNETAYECIEDFLEIVNKIKEHDDKITAYKLDRMIWLCCSGNFFLDKKFNLKTILFDKLNKNIFEESL